MMKGLFFYENEVHLHEKEVNFIKSNLKGSMFWYEWSFSSYLGKKLVLGGSCTFLWKWSSFEVWKFEV